MNEGDGSIPVCVTVSNGMLGRTVNVTIVTMDGSATSIDPKDFSAVSDTLQLYEITTNICVNISIIDDNRVENPEEFTVVIITLSFDQDVDSVNPSSTVVTVFVTINDNDEAEIGFERAEYHYKEGEEVAVCVRVDRNHERTILFNITAWEDESTKGYRHNFV